MFGQVIVGNSIVATGSLSYALLKAVTVSTMRPTELVSVVAFGERESLVGTMVGGVYTPSEEK